MNENDAEQRNVSDVQAWQYYPQYGRRMWVQFTDGSAHWVSMDSRLADEIYRRHERDDI